MTLHKTRSYLAVPRGTHDCGQDPVGNQALKGLEGLQCPFGTYAWESGELPSSKTLLPTGEKGGRVVRTNVSPCAVRASLAHRFSRGREAPAGGSAASCAAPPPISGGTKGATPLERATSAPAELGGGNSQRLARNRARTQVLPQALKSHVHGSGTFDAFGS